MTTRLRERLNELILASGSVEKAATLLGLQKDAVYTWIYKGKASVIGALLVERSVILGKVFTANELRPDVSERRFEQAEKDIRFRKARKRQKEFESSPVSLLNSTNIPICSYNMISFGKFELFGYLPSKSRSRLSTFPDEYKSKF